MSMLSIIADWQKVLGDLLEENYQTTSFQYNLYSASNNMFNFNSSRAQILNRNLLCFNA